MSKPLWRISCGLVAVVVLVSAVIIGVTLHERLVQARARADVAEGRMTLAEGNLEETETTLHATRSDLARTRHRLGRVTTQATTLGQQSHACRYLVKVNDHLLSGSIAYQHATGQLLKTHPHMGVVKRSIDRAHHHAVAVIALTKHAGYRNLDELVFACVPSRR